MPNRKNQKINDRSDRLQDRTVKKEQRRQIREFDKELFSYTGQIAWLLPGIFSFIALILLFVPVQELESGDRALYMWGPMSAIWISFFILQPYLFTTEPFAGSRQNIHKTYDKLKYLPVSKKQYELVRLGYLFRYTWKLTAVGMFLQCLSAAWIAGYADIWNILYVIVVLLLTPLLTGWLLIKLYSMT